MDTQESLAVRVWRVAAARLQERHAECYRMWFAQMVPVRLDKDGTELILGVSCDFFGEWVVSNYHDLLDDALADIDGQSYTWAFEEGYEPVPEPETAAAPAAEAPAADVSSVADIPDVADIPEIKPIVSSGGEPSADDSKSVAGAPVWLNVTTIVAGIAALVVIGLCTWSLFCQAAGPDAGPNGLASFYSETDRSR